MGFERVLIVGGGTMGADLAVLMIRQGVSVTVKELNKELAEKVKSEVCARIQSWVDRGKIEEYDAYTKRGLLSVTDNFDNLNSYGLLVIEAVPEKLDLKQRIFAELEERLPQAVLTSNTSSLPISELSALMKNRSNLVGMHFFNPPTRMPLVEMIPSEYSALEAVKAVDRFSREVLQKNVITVKDRPGFLINVLLGAYFQPAIRAMEETSVEPEAVDREAQQFGWPIGPFLLMDMLGLDVAVEVMKMLVKAYPDRFGSADGKGKTSLLELLVSKGMFGKKSGVGFYNYGKTADVPLSQIRLNFQPQKSAGEAPPTPKATAGEAKAVFEKMTEAFLREAAIAYKDGVASKEDIVTGCLYGLGFPERQKQIFDRIGGQSETW